MSSNTIIMERMSLLMNAHFVLLELLPLLLLTLVPTKSILGVESINRNYDEEGLYNLLVFISGPTLTFITANVSIFMLGILPLHGGSRTQTLTLEFFSAFAMSLTICCALQILCGIIAWFVLHCCVSGTLALWRTSIAQSADEQNAIFKFFDLGMISIQDNMFPPSSHLCEGRAACLIWTLIKLVCLWSQYKYLYCELSRFDQLHQFLHYLSDEFLEMTDSHFDVNSCTRPQRLHPRALDLPSDVFDLSEMEIPAEYLCPISREICRQPTLVASGITYDLPNISRWIAEGDGFTKDPVTGDYISFESLYPNFAIRQSISRWAEEFTQKQTSNKRRFTRSRAKKQGILQSKSFT